MKTGSTLVFQKTFGSQLDEEALSTLRSVAQRRTYKPGTTLCHQGQQEDTLYIIVEGSIVTMQQLDDGTDRMLGQRGPNEYFGELGLLDDAPRMASCITLMETTVLEVTKEVFSQLMERSPAVAMGVAQRIVASLRKIDREAINDLTAKNDQLAQAYSELRRTQAQLVEKQRLERELELASDIQRRLLPTALPAFSNYQLAAHLRPARQVGGDFYNVFEIDADHVGLVLGDVADKGAHAALFMAITQTLFLRESRGSLSPAHVAMEVHRGLMEVAPTTELFVTAFYGVLHRPSGVLRYACAGHDPPLLYRPSQAVRQLPGKGRFLGLLDGLTLEDSEFQLQPGDRLVIFSDGATEAFSVDDEIFGLERLRQLITAHGTSDARALMSQIVTTVESWCRGNTAAVDDLTLLVVQAS